MGTHSTRESQNHAERVAWVRVQPRDCTHTKLPNGQRICGSWGTATHWEGVGERCHSQRQNVPDLPVVWDARLYASLRVRQAGFVHLTEWNFYLQEEKRTVSDVDKGVKCEGLMPALAWLETHRKIGRAKAGLDGGNWHPKEPSLQQLIKNRACPLGVYYKTLTLCVRCFQNKMVEKAGLNKHHRKGLPKQGMRLRALVPTGCLPSALGTGLLKWGLHPTQSQPSHSIIFLKAIYKRSLHQWKEHNWSCATH